ncbi:MAG: nucleotide exchange factor GrpE [Dehalococcoidales bacterium]|nr:nucleotide exchange factor GrpE [Dehalococcoidales bacterium]
MNDKVTENMPGDEMPPETTSAELNKALAEEKQKAEDYLASWQRAQADFINYKRRIEQEREDFSKSANASLIFSLLPVLDDFERALNAIPEAEASQDWMEGIRLVERKLRAAVITQGLTPIKALGEPFDPNYHEAVKQEKGEEGIVIDELRKGYLLHGKLLRPSAVIVGSGEAPEKEE